MTTATPTDAQALARALEFDRGIFVRTAEKALRIPWGWAWWDTRFPNTWSLNAVRVVGPLDQSVGPAEFVAELDRLHAAALHRFAIVEDDDSGERLAAPLREAGWRVVREVVSVLREPRDREPAPGLAREATEEELQPVEVESMLEEAEFDDTPESRLGAAQVVAGRAAERAALPRSRRFLGSWQGRPGAVATLFSDGRTAMVESVGTISPLRGHGLARAVVSAAIDAALADGHELVVIFADDDDWPKELYFKLGFRPVGHVWQFVRMPRRG